MKLFKRIAAAVITAAIAISATACADTSWVFKYGDKTVNSGLYLAFEASAYATAGTKVADTKVDMFKQKIDDKDVKTWIIDETKKLTGEYIAIENKFEEMGLAFSESDINEINQVMKTEWLQYKDLYEKNGIGEKSYRLLAENRKKSALIFEKYYSADGGVEPITDDSLMVHYKENFASINYFPLNKAKAFDDTTDTADIDKQNEELKALTEEYVERFNKGEATFNEILDEYAHKVDESTHDGENAADVIGKDTDTRRFIKKDSTSPSEEFVKAVFAMKADKKAAILSDDNSYYFVARYDVTDSKSFEEMRISLLSDLKGEDYNTVIVNWGAAIQPTEVNNSAVNRYKPKNIDLKTASQP